VGSYQSGIAIIDFSNPAAPREIAYADPKPLTTEPPTTGIVLGGDWSTYWHNGYIYESDIKRGLITWQLNLGADASMAQANEHLKRTNTFATSNPQTQATSSPARGQAARTCAIAPASWWPFGVKITPAPAVKDVVAAPALERRAEGIGIGVVVADDVVVEIGARETERLKAGEGPATSMREAQIMIGHPNNSGLQMDQVTQLYVPAFFINELRLWQDDSLVLTMEGGISISEDPNIRFTYVSNGAKRFRAEAKDTNGHVFQREWKVDDSGM